MSTWLSGTRGTIAIIITWTVGWGLGFGGLMELYDPDGKIGDVWPTVFAIPGFIGGILFSMLVRIAEGGVSINEIPIPRAVAWGIVTGLVLGLLTIPAKVGDVSPGALGMIAIMTALSVVAALASVTIFRLLARRQSPDRPAPSGLR